MISPILHALIGISLLTPSEQKGNQCLYNTKSHFNYDPSSEHGPNRWGHKAPCCSSKLRQSPRELPIHPGNGACVKELKFKNYQQVDGTFYNNGHAPNFDVAPGIKPATVCKVPGARENEYRLAGVHFHFGDKNRAGSEHSLGTRRYPGEMHMVHFNAKYPTLGDAMDKVDGLMVIGVFLEINDAHADSALNRLLNLAKRFDGINKGVKTSVNPNALLPEKRRFVTYAGSLTTPPCLESVTWIVMTQPVSVTNKNMETLRTLLTSDGNRMAEFSNARPIQALQAKKTQPVRRSC